MTDLLKIWKRVYIQSGVKHKNSLLMEKIWHNRKTPVATPSRTNSAVVRLAQKSDELSLKWRKKGWRMINGVLNYIKNRP